MTQRMMARLKLFGRFLTSGRRRQRLVGATIFGMLVAFIPGIAWSLPSITVSAGTTTPPPANGAVTASASCGATNVVLGGGISITTSPDGVMTSSVQSIGGTEPGQSSSLRATNGQTNQHFWLGVDGAGKMTDPKGGATAFAVCDSGSNGHTYSGGTTIYTNQISGPSSSTTANLVSVTCATGSMISGGGYTFDPRNGLKLVASFPSNASGQPAATASHGGNAGSMYWTAVGAIGGMGSQAGDFTEAFIVCGSTVNTTDIEQASTAGPNTANTTQRIVTPQCPMNQVILGGGYSVDGHIGNYNGSTNWAQSNDTGVHAVGSYPSNSAGVSVTSGSATFWTADGHSGGMVPGGSPNNTHVWAVCT